MKASRETSTAGTPRRSTLLELVSSLAQQGTSEQEIVAIALDLVESGRVVLIGNFRGASIRDPDDEPGGPAGASNR